MQLVSLLLKILAVFLLFLPLLIAASQAVIMQGSDFVMTFYPVGKMVVDGLAQNIYPPPSATSFVDAPFNLYVHQLLTFLPKQYVAVYMYSPLMALFFVPFSFMTPQHALIAWQVFSIIVLALVAWLSSRGDRWLAIEYFSMLALFCPVFHTLLIGHLGIVVGLLPLALGYAFLSRGREIAGGMVWGALLLKPQFLPTALLVCGALFLSKRPKATIGLALGLLLFGLATVFSLGPSLFVEWLKSFKMSDTIFAKAGYQFPAYMVVSLPAVIVQTFPGFTATKIVAYGLAAVIGLYALWRGTAILNSAKPELESTTNTVGSLRSYRAAVALVMLEGLFVLPLVLPHFLFYDFCGIGLLAVIAGQGHLWGEEAGRVKFLRQATWWCCNLYYVSFMFLPVAALKQWYALLLVAVFAFFFFKIPGVACSRKT
ncbi:MAG: glycosyltransferase family 87 protein [Candidatus Melainabacteria bacterium]|nr:glycosyltransferase family 87 protein [Candidatus Melainabacteria bacterium]